MLGNLLKLYVKENERIAGMNMRDDRTIKLLVFKEIYGVNFETILY